MGLKLETWLSIIFATKPQNDRSCPYNAVFITMHTEYACALTHKAEQKNPALASTKIKH